PRHRHALHPVVRAIDPRHARGDEAGVLEEVQMLPGETLEVVRLAGAPRFRRAPRFIAMPVARARLAQMLDRRCLALLLALLALLHYVLRPDAITADKLFGAVAVYLMLGITWAFAYGVLEYFHPGAFTLGGTAKVLEFSELIYFSFVVLTSTGFGDILPAM